MALEVTPAGTLEERLRAAVGEVVSGQRRVYAAKPGRCLQVVREVVSPALGFDVNSAWGWHNVYSRSRVEGNESGTAWARSTQRTMRDVLGLQLPLFDVRVGDLIFNPAIDKTYGHVAVVVAVTESSVLLLENTSTERGIKLDGCNRLLQLDTWPYLQHAEAMRFAEV